MREAGFLLSGMAAPFGTWTPDLGRVIDRLGLEYSSEFAYAYDTLPLLPCAADACADAAAPDPSGEHRKSAPCRVYSAHMSTYFRRGAMRCCARDLPLAFYHHPTHGALGCACIAPTTAVRGGSTRCAWMRWRGGGPAAIFVTAVVHRRGWSLRCREGRRDAAHCGYRICISVPE